jgi:hypothetical protein
MARYKSSTARATRHWTTSINLRSTFLRVIGRTGMADTSAKPGSVGWVWHPVDFPEGYHAAPSVQDHQCLPGIQRHHDTAAHRMDADME